MKLVNDYAYGAYAQEMQEREYDQEETVDINQVLKELDHNNPSVYAEDRYDNCTIDGWNMYKTY